MATVEQCMKIILGFNPWIYSPNTSTTAPNGIKKLRELILELAVRGLLVPQNRNDEPARVLLGNVVEGRIKNSELLSKTNKDKIPFTLPN